MGSGYDFVGQITTISWTSSWRLLLAHSPTALLVNWGASIPLQANEMISSQLRRALFKHYVHPQTLSQIVSTLGSCFRVSFACLMSILSSSCARIDAVDYTSVFGMLAHFHGMDVSFNIWRWSCQQVPWRMVFELYNIRGRRYSKF